MRKCGFHVQQTSNELRRAIEAVQPTLIVSLAHDRDFWRVVKAGGWPGLLVGRLFEEGADWRAVDPREWAERCASQMMPYDAWITRNEPEDIYNWVTADDARRYDEWCCWFRARLLEISGQEAVGPNVPAGHWHGDAIVKHLPELCKTFRYISLHEYSARAMWDQQPKKQRPPGDVPRDEGASVGWWYTLRYRQWWRAICQQWPWRAGQFQMVISEGGVAYGVMENPAFGDVGWRTDLSEDQYFDSLDWYTRELNKDDYCLGWAIYMVGAADPKWGSFETLPLCERRLWTIPQVVVEEPPEEEPVSSDDIRVVDLEYKERDFQYAKDKYGVAFRRAQVKPGQKVWRLVELWEKSGNSSLITQVLGEDGKPGGRVDVAFYWPGAPDPPDPPTAVYAHDWYRRFVHGMTDGVNNEVGPGMGTGAYHGKGEGGPHAVWVRDPEIPSDICEKLGMLAGTFHDHLDQKFQLVVEGGDGGDGGGDGEEGEGKFVVTLRERTDGGASNQILVFPTGRDLYDVMANLRCGSWEIDDLVAPKRIDGVPGYDLCPDYPEKEDRTYEFQLVDIGHNNAALCDWIPCQFEAGRKSVWRVEMEWQKQGEEPEEEPPEEEPEPGTSEAARLVAEIKERLNRLEEILGEVDAHTEAAARLL